MPTDPPAVYVAAAVAAGTRNIRGFLPPPDWTPSRSAGLQRRNDRGEPLRQDEVPEALYYNPARKPIADIPPFVQAGPYPCVSDAITQAMRTCDLGQGNLYPIQLLKADGRTPFDTKHWFLNPGNRKQAFEPGESTILWIRPPGVDKPDHPEATWSVTSDCKPDKVAVRASALDGPDIWVDPKVRGVFFVSQRLRDALVPVGGDRALGLVRCRVLTRH